MGIRYAHFFVTIIAMLCCRIQHIFDENAISRRRVVHQHMGDSADEFSVLNDRTAGHADVK